jgi:hypothetical protein
MSKERLKIELGKTVLGNNRKITLVLSSTCFNYIPFLVFSYLNFIPSIRKRLE